MFGGENGNPVFPVFMEDNQFQYDSNTSTQLQLFGNFLAGCNLDPTNFIGSDGDSTMNHPNKRSKDSEDISRQHKLNISLNNLYQDEVDRSRNITPNLNSVSTGLRLSYEDDERHSSISSSSGGMGTLPVILSLGNNLRNEIDHQKEEFDHYIKAQEEYIVKGVREMKQRHMATLLNTIEKGVEIQLREKELEIETMNKKNRELVEKIKQVAMEAQSWHHRAKYNESMVNVLKTNLKQAIAQGADQGKEGCGDSEVDDAASSYDQNVLGYNFVSSSRRHHGQKESMICKSCRSREVSFLLLPCRHLCLCKDCDGSIEVCPVCRLVKTASVEVYMS